MAYWPFSLPQYPLVSSLREVPEDNLATSQNSVGPEKRRLRSALAHKVHTYLVGHLYSIDQVDEFWDFYENNASHGAIPHVQVHPRKGATTRIIAQFIGTPEFKEITINGYRLSVSVRELGDLPSWLPLADGNPPTIYADFANNYYWYRYKAYGSFSTWLAAID